MTPDLRPDELEPKEQEKSGVPASPSGLRPFGAEPAAQSQAEPLVPNAWAATVAGCYIERGQPVLAMICCVTDVSEDDAVRRALRDMGAKYPQAAVASTPLVVPFTISGAKILNNEDETALNAARPSSWQPIETAPENEAILIWLPGAEHYGAPVYRAILVNMGSGKRWHSCGVNVGRDIAHHPRRPTHWMPLPAPPASGMSAFGQDPKGLEAKPASPVGEAETPDSQTQVASPKGERS